MSVTAAEAYTIAVAEQLGVFDTLVLERGISGGRGLRSGGRSGATAIA